MFGRRSRSSQAAKERASAGTPRFLKIILFSCLVFGFPTVFLIRTDSFDVNAGLAMLDLPTTDQIVGMMEQSSAAAAAVAAAAVENRKTTTSASPSSEAAAAASPADPEKGKASEASSASSVVVASASEAADPAATEQTDTEKPDGVSTALDGKNRAVEVSEQTDTEKPIATSSDAVSATSGVKTPTIDPEKDKDCPFRDSPIYRKVYVYPNHGDVDNGWGGDILSEAGRDLENLPRWPWLDLDAQARHNGTAMYNRYSVNVQYATELLVRDVMTNPKSCLRTYNPEEATLFYVPYLPSIEHHKGSDRGLDYNTSPYGKAIMDILDKDDYSGWEKHYGLTSKYWKRRNGADHILVFSEPMHGLWHPRSRRGNYHFINSQKQLKPPIVISVELSTTFINTYPKCSAKNILMPYPNTDGDWFNGKYVNEAATMLRDVGTVVATSDAGLPVERELALSADATAPAMARPIAQFYAAGNHGTCRSLRIAMKQDYTKCSPSFRALNSKYKYKAKQYSVGMQVATFCPCPGGDSPSAKRHFDALIAGCIPIILSLDYVWPFTNEFDPEIGWDPNDFSIRLNASDYGKPLLDPATCKPKNETRPGLQAYLESIPAEEIQRLRQGVKKAKYMYSWYTHNENVVENPLREGVLPDGGAAHTLVKMLAERAAGAMWPACQAELKTPRPPDVWKFKC